MKVPLARTIPSLFLAMAALILTITSPRQAQAQCPTLDYNDGAWTWMAGSNQVNQFGNYGTQNVEAPSNSPGGREAVTGWSAVDGNFYMFGGFGYGATQGPPSNVTAALNDLWKFNPINGQWTFKRGSSFINQSGTYAVLGAENPSNLPGGRYHHMTWTTPDGKLWLYGGVGFGSGSGFLRDLWYYNTTTNNWAWIKGNGSTGATGTYGSQGVPAPSNLPGGRRQSVTWVTPDGCLWMFGGRGCSASQVDVRLNDLWKYDPSTNNWTWINGSTAGNQPGVYGNKGVPAAGNVPSAREGNAGWIDNQGNLWLHGGLGVSATGSADRLNDLWKFNPTTTEWTWMSGTNAANAVGSYGTRGTASPSNIPGSRVFGLSWVDQNNNFYMFGGEGYGSTATSGILNDLWMYDPGLNTWTWIDGPTTVNQSASYGTKGQIAPSNLPGSRRIGVPWKDASNQLWLFGGGGLIESGFGGYLNDVWKFSPFLAFSTDEDISTSYTVPGIDPSLNPNVSIIQFPDQGAFEMVNESTGEAYYVPPTDWFGQTSAVLSLTKAGCPTTTAVVTITVNPVDDCGYYLQTDYVKTTYVNVPTSVTMQMYDVDGGSTMTITNGPSNGTAAFIDDYTIAYTPDLDFIGTETFDVILTGGTCSPTTATVTIFVDPLPICPEFNYNDAHWTWTGGTRLPDQFGDFGTQGVTDPTNRPPGLGATMSWTGTNGLWWFYAGNGMASGGIGRLSDLWKFDPSSSLWTWMKGNGQRDQFGVYGTQGTPAPGNRPGSRYFHNSWTAADGTLWLFGGNGAGASNSGLLNDLWKYDPTTNNWTWMKGSNSANQPASYGTLGVASPTNTPGARSRAYSWTDADGTFWLFGGSAPARLNDLWKYTPPNPSDPTSGMWIWMGGSNLASQPGTYGTRGVPSTTNIPGARYAGASWTGADGNLYLFGGVNSGYWNDLWRYSPSTGEWTWLHGPAAAGQPGVYGVEGEATSATLPLGRGLPLSWVGPDDCLWLFGGNNNTTGTNYLNDLWKYDPRSNTWLWASGSNTFNQSGNYGTMNVPSATNRPGARDGGLAQWVDTYGQLWMYGGGGYTDTGFGTLGDMWAVDPGLALTINEDTPTTYAVPVFDPDDIGTISIIQAPADGTLTSIGGTTGTLYYVPPPDWSGVTTAVLSLTGGTCGETTSIFTINVLPVNDPPVITSYSYSPVPACVNQLTTFTVTATDIDGGSLTYAFNFGDGSTTSSLPQHVYTATGIYVATVQVSDGFDAVTSSILVEVIYPCPGFDLTDWEWKGGDDHTNQKWTADRPGARHGSVSWTGLDGSLWLFGGEGLAGITGTDTGRLGDLWRFDVTSNTWQLKNNTTTVSRQLNRQNFYSDTTTSTVYGEMTSTTLSPGARVYAASWVDASGKFWLFGGYGRGTSRTGYLNDLWKYDPVTDQWTCVTPEPTDIRIVSQNGWNSVMENWPGWRQNAQTWKDGAGNLWLFGGYGHAKDNTTPGYLNDLWKYDVALGTWAQILGSTNSNQKGNYTTEIRPGARYNSVGWADTSGTLYLFGGFGYGTADAGHLNDLWRFDTANTTWTLLSGGGQVNQFGIYAGLPGQPQSGGRHGAVSWMGVDGNLYMFGGWGYGDREYGRLNDLWRFNVSSGQWQCVSRSLERVFSMPGVYTGPDGTVRPGGRDEAVAWARPDGTIWLFGGRGYATTMGPDYLSDLWSYGAAFVIGAPGVPGPIGPTGPVTITIPLDDPAGDATLAIQQQPAHGQAIIQAGETPTLVYQPNIGFSGQDQMTLHVYNSACGGEVAPVMINIAPASMTRVEDYHLY